MKFVIALLAMFMFSFSALADHQYRSDKYSDPHHYDRPQYEQHHDRVYPRHYESRDHADVAALGMFVGGLILSEIVTHHVWHEGHEWRHVRVCRWFDEVGDYDHIYRYQVCRNAWVDEYNRVVEVD